MRMPVAAPSAHAYEVKPPAAKKTLPAASTAIPFRVGRPAAVPAMFTCGTKPVVVVCANARHRVIKKREVVDRAPIATSLWVEYQRAPIPIAVLPLINLSQDSANDYFADGLTDEIIRNLSIIDGLAVRSQTSSFEFKGKPRNVREAGKQLDADYIVEGSVLRAGQRLRIPAAAD